MPNTRNQFRYWSQLVFVAAISAVAAASSVDAAPYDIVVKSMKTKIRIGGYDYSLEGRLFRPEGEGQVSPGRPRARYMRQKMQAQVSGKSHGFSRAGLRPLRLRRVYVQ